MTEQETTKCLVNILKLGNDLENADIKKDSKIAFKQRFKKILLTDTSELVNTSPDHHFNDTSNWHFLSLKRTITTPMESLV